MIPLLYFSQFFLRFSGFSQFLNIKKNPSKLPGFRFMHFIYPAMQLCRKSAPIIVDIAVQMALTMTKILFFFSVSHMTYLLSIESLRPCYSP